MKNKKIIVLLLFLILLAITFDVFLVFKGNIKIDSQLEDSEKEVLEDKEVYNCTSRVSEETNTLDINILYTLKANDIVILKEEQKYTAYTQEEKNNLKEIQAELRNENYECHMYEKNPYLVCTLEEEMSSDIEYLEELKESGYTCQKIS